MKEIKCKTKIVNNPKEWAKIEKENSDRMVSLKQQDDGSFECSCSRDEIPVPIVNEMLKQLHAIYREHAFNDAFKNIDEKHKQFTAMLGFKYRFHKGLALVWFACFLACLLYILTGGR